MAEWRFYGRERELAKVGRFINTPGFDAGLVTGGRGIGKTELMQELRGRMGRQAQILIFEMRDPVIENQVDANERLIETIRHDLPQKVSSSTPPASEFEARWPRERFVGIIRHLLAQGAVVCLDEFQMAKPMGLEGGLKLLIDRSRSLNGPRPPGKLIMMGSHQQQVLDMFACTEPLHGRATVASKLRPWPLPTVFGMAQEQSFLQYPGRLLTLWTAFGGVPGRWRRFAREEAGRLAEMGAWKSDRDWRMAFLDWHRDLLQDNPRERFDNKAYVELAEPAREALLHLAQKPVGMTLSEFPTELREKPNDGLRKSLDMLVKHLEMVERYGQFMVKGDPRWRIADNSALFQITVYPELFREAYDEWDTPPDNESTTPLERLQNLEGPVMGRMAAAWLASQQDVTWSRQGAWRKPVNRTDLADIDAIAFRSKSTDPDSVLVMAGCKRNADKHRPNGLKQDFENFLAEIGDKAGDRFRSLARETLLVSPVFTDDQRRLYRQAGFRAVGMHDMARETGIEPAPAAAVKAGPGEPKRSRRRKTRDDGPSFDMCGDMMPGAAIHERNG